MWSQHLQHLAWLVCPPGDFETTELEAYIRWYLLLLDTQLSLIGTPGSGIFVRAYLARDAELLCCPTREGTAQMSVDHHAKYSATDGSKDMGIQYAKLSCLASQMRDETKLGRGCALAKQYLATGLRNEIHSMWNTRENKIYVQQPSGATFWSMRTVFNLVNISAGFPLHVDARKTLRTLN